MKPGEYVVLGFVGLMLATFFILYIRFQIKRIKRNRAKKNEN